MADKSYFLLHGQHVLRLPLLNRWIQAVPV